MYELAKKAREGMKAKARRLASDSVGKVDSSTWSPAPLLRADIKTGARPIMKPSKKGIGESNAARDTKAAIGNPARGAFKQGGAVKKDGGILDKKAVGDVEVMPKRGAAQHYKKGGRIKKLSGGTLSSYVKKAGYDLADALAAADSRSGPVSGLPAKGYNRAEGISRAIEKLKGKSGTAEKRGGRIKKLSGGTLANYAKEAAKDLYGALGTYDSQDEGGDWDRKLYNRKQGIGLAAEKLKRKGDTSITKKAGGRIKREEGGPLPSPYEAMESEARRKTIKVDRPADRKLPSAKEAAASAARVGDVPEGRKHGGKAKKIAKRKGGGVGLTVVIADKGSRGMPQPGMAAPIAPRAVPVPPAAPAPMPAPAAPPPAAMQPAPMGRKSGGRITKVASSYKDMEAGAATGEGRLQKTDIAKKHKDAPARKDGGRISKIASSYKDMTAGAGDGEGRLQKTDIAKKRKFASLSRG